MLPCVNSEKNKLHCYVVIKNHQPSQLLDLVSPLDSLRPFIKENDMFDDVWNPLRVYRYDSGYKDHQCLHICFFKKDP